MTGNYIASFRKTKYARNVFFGIKVERLGNTKMRKTAT